MSESSQKRSADFLSICDQFQLGELTTEGSHPVTADLSQLARQDTVAGLQKLFEVDGDVLKKYREFVESGRAVTIKEAVLRSLRSGGKLFFTGCGSTGRLSIQLVSIWRDYWQRQRSQDWRGSLSAEDLEGRAFAVMAGGDYALIKAVEGFEDFTEFGAKQIEDLGVSESDTVFAITEGGETSFVIGTAWRGVKAGAKVYFVYNNPDEVLCRLVGRSRDVIEDHRVEKLNLTTGPMAITGSTRMQATTIQLCVLLTVLEMVLRELIYPEVEASGALRSEDVPSDFFRYLTAAYNQLGSGSLLGQLSRLVALEEATYRSGNRNNYFADRFGIDVLTDTTERSPTYCTPPFRKFDDTTATESWAFLFVPERDTRLAWERIIKRRPVCLEWAPADIRDLVEPEKFDRTVEILRKISYGELMRFKVGLDGLPFRPLKTGDCAVAILSHEERSALLSPDGVYRKQLEAAQKAGARIGLIYLGPPQEIPAIESSVAAWAPQCVSVFVPVPRAGLLLDAVTRVLLKMVINALSTCTMVRLGRVMGNFMIWVVPSNLKLIDRATRYIQNLAGLEYREANELLFEVIEYVEPRMKSDRAYPPVVGVAVVRARFGIGNEEAEERLSEFLKS